MCAIFSMRMQAYVHTHARAQVGTCACHAPAQLRMCVIVHMCVCACVCVCESRWPSPPRMPCTSPSHQSKPWLGPCPPVPHPMPPPSPLRSLPAAAGQGWHQTGQARLAGEWHPGLLPGRQEQHQAGLAWPCRTGAAGGRAGRWLRRPLAAVAAAVGPAARWRLRRRLM